MVQGSGGSGAGWNGALGVDGGGNLDADPQFIVPVDPDTAPTSDGDLRLTFGSPAMDAGDDAVATAATDVEGNLRIIAPQVDMGAYEVAAVCFATMDAITVYSSTTSLAVQQAVDALTADQVVKVAGYCAGVQSRGSVLQTVHISKSLTLRGGYSPEQWAASMPVSYPTTLDAQGLGRGVYVVGAGQVTLENMRIANGVASGAGQVNGGGIRVADTDVTLSGCEVINGKASNGGGVAYLGTGIARVVNVLFARNTASSTGAAIYLNAAGSAHIVHTTIASPTIAARSGIYVGMGNAYITNTLVASQTTGIVQDATGVVQEDYNLFAHTTTPTSGYVSSGQHSVVGAAYFANSAGGDYHLTASSDAIDAGVNAGVNTDFEGDARPDGKGFDIGYDEYIVPVFKVYLPLVVRN